VVVADAGTRRRADGNGVELAAHARDDLRAGGAARRIGVEQAHEKSIEVLRDLVALEAQRGRPVVSLLQGDLEGLAVDRQLPRDGLVQRDAEAVPVGRRRDGAAPRLLRGHVGDGPHEPLGRRRRRIGAGRERGDEAEIEKHDAARLGHEDVGRLDVAVELAALVQRVQGER
jgi:hypothetical protein